MALADNGRLIRSTATVLLLQQPLGPSHERSVHLTPSTTPVPERSNVLPRAHGPLPPGLPNTRNHPQPVYADRSISISARHVEKHHYASGLAAALAAAAEGNDLHEQLGHAAVPSKHRVWSFHSSPIGLWQCSQQSAVGLSAHACREHSGHAPAKQQHKANV